MVDIRRARMRRWLIVPLVPLVLLGGCASAGRMPAASRQAPWTREEIVGAAALLEMEDRRELDLPQLEAAARSDSPVLRARAALAAGRLRTQAGRPLVRDLLTDPDSSVRSAAAFAAGLLGDSLAVPALGALLGSPELALHPTVGIEVATALGTIGGAPARSALVAFLDSAAIADPAIAPVVGAALIGAWRAGESSLPPFTRWLTSPDAEIRWRAVYTLTRRGRPDAVEHLLPLLADPEPLVRAFAVRGLTSPVVRAASRGPDEVLPRILELLADPAYPVRIETIRAVGSYADPRAGAALAELLVRGAPHEVLTALESLPGTGPFAGGARPVLLGLSADPARPDFVRATALTTLQALDPVAARPILQSAMRDPSWRVRAQVATDLAAYRLESLPDLEQLARDRDPRVAAAALEAAIRAVGMAGIQQLGPILVESLAARDVQVRAAALRGFSFLADPATFPILLDAYEQARHDEENEAAIAALDAIAELGLVGVLAPERAFFARFPRPDDPQVHRRALVRFREAARTAWGEAPPIVGGTTPAMYESFLEAWSAPGRAEALPRVRIETEIGPIDLILYGDAAPLTVANFLELARSGFFDGQEFARLIPDFVLQGGDPRGDTSGGPGYTIRDELNRHQFLTGSVGMALSGPDTGGSQFFITHSPQPHLDGDYTIFARVLAGQEYVDRLVPGERILTIRVLEGASR